MSRSRTKVAVSALLLALVVSAVGLARDAVATPASKVYLNGVPYPVYFNDGDSFRVLGGPLKGTKARLAGFNTLESYGKTHSWGGWDPKELYHNAKMGTYNARRGPCWDDASERYRRGCSQAWHCTSDMKRDGYGRILWWCPDLAEDQIRKGLAHVMSVKGPGIPMLVAAQAEAIKNRRGMWSHGVPRYVVTSLHAADEPWFGGFPYNRMVSSVTGASRKWKHRKIYSECDNVCWWEVVLTPAAHAMGIKALRADPTLAGFIKAYDDDRLRALLNSYRLNGDLGLVRNHRNKGVFDLVTTRKHLVAFDQALSALVQGGGLTILSKELGSCMVHAAFNRRYGSGSASCLH